MSSVSEMTDGARGPGGRGGMSRPRAVRMIIVFAASALVLSLSSPGAATAQVVDDPDPMGSLDALAWAEEVIECTQIDQETFCTEFGFLTFEPDSKEWITWLGEALSTDVSSNGDISTTDLIALLHELPDKELAERQADQIATARDAVGRVKLIDALASNEPLPEGFFQNYPSLGIEEGSSIADGFRAASRDGADTPLLQVLSEYGVELPTAAELDPFGEEPALRGPSEGPWSRYVIYNYYTEMEKYEGECCYCGPATMQAIDWADDGGKDSQTVWANLLGTHSGGGCATALSSIVSRINSNTDWDTTYGGSYSMVSLDGRTQSYYMLMHELRIGVGGAPVVEHVMIDTEYFPYLDKHWWSSGHFQTGRGYSYNTDTISIFEPYDERDCITGGAASGKVQYVSLSNMYNASQAHSHKNMGA